MHKQSATPLQTPLALVCEELLSATRLLQSLHFSRNVALVLQMQCL